MKTKNLTGCERHAILSELYEDAVTCYADVLAAYERHLAQYRGSDEIDGSQERALTVRNITYEIIESEISSDIPRPKVDAAFYSERRERCAENIERLLSSLRDGLPYERMNDLDERYTYIYGGSVWYAEWDNDRRVGREVGGVRLYCLAPRDFIPQPGVTEVEDMDYCFLRFSTTGAEIMSKYGIGSEALSSCECEDAREECGEYSTYTVISAFYKDEDGEIGRLIYSGDTVLLDMPRAYGRKRRVCSLCREAEDACRCKKKKPMTEELVYERIEEEAVLSALLPSPILYPRAVPYYTPRRFPIVIRRNVSLDGSLTGQSDCEYVRPCQQAINKIESRILMKLLRAGITPIVPEDATVSVNNQVFGQVIRMKPGESAQQYGKVDTTPDISQDIAEAERLYNHAKRILGISDALQGIAQSGSESGYSRRLMIAQATGRLESKRKMKHTAYADLDRIIFELYLAFADEPRALVYKDAYGRTHNAQFSRYDFLEYDGVRGELYYDDSYLFSVDLNGGAEYQRDALWERNLENLKAGTLGSPDSPATLLRYWQCQERAHYPYARENVEYFNMILKEGESDGLEEAL